PPFHRPTVAFVVPARLAGLVRVGLVVGRAALVVDDPVLVGSLAAHRCLPSGPVGRRRRPASGARAGPPLACAFGGRPRGVPLDRLDRRSGAVPAFRPTGGRAASSAAPSP